MKQALLHYDVIAEIGRGGMGVVYKARDTHLDRLTAIKVLPADKVADPERTRRFIAEAKAASALNHPNIVTIYDINSDQSVHFIVMEYVAGKTLDELIHPKGLRVSQALKYAVQMADALATAHAAGIVHRDLKPANVIVTDDGRVKILDFGLAKLTDQLDSAPQGPTLTARPTTGEGSVVGTPAYMSPEQAEGRKLDGRSDIFSFGSVLYEMVTGHRTFSGDSSLSIMTRVLNEDPRPPSQLASSIPAELEKLILRCLRKDPNRRYQTMADLKVALEDLREESPSSGQVATPLRAQSRGRWAWVVLGAVLLAGAVIGWRQLRAPERSEPLVANPLTTYPGAERFPSLSPDGNQVAFSWSGLAQDNDDIYVQVIGSGGPLRLTNHPGRDWNPVWSPDGRSIAFLRGQDSGRLEVRLVPPLGGLERKLTEIYVGQTAYVNVGYLAWSADSKYLIVTNSQGERKPDALFAASVETGEMRPITRPGSPVVGDSMAAVSPDGRRLAFRRGFGINVGEIHVLSLKDGLIADGDSKPLTAAVWNAEYPVWMGDGREIIFSARNGLWRMPAGGEGPPARLPFIGEFGTMPAVSPGRPGVAPRLVYVRSFLDSNIWRVASARPGTPASVPAVLIASTRTDVNPQFSPDGRRIAFSSSRSGDFENWIADQDGSNAFQLTAMGAVTTGTPRWSPDGQLIVFDSNLEGQAEIYVVPATGGKPRRMTTHAASDRVPSFSHDGKWIYFSSKRSGDDQIWKIPSSGGEAVQVTSNGGYVAFESADGAYVYYTQTPGLPSTLWRVPTGGGQPVKIVDGVIDRAFTVLEKGVYYIDRPAARADARLQFFDFTTRASSAVVANLGRQMSYGLTATADGRTILYSRIDSSTIDLMLVDNFR